MNVSWLARSVLLFLLLPIALGACATRESGPISSPREQSQAKVRFDRALLSTDLDSMVALHASDPAGWRPAPGIRRDAIEATFEGTSFVVPEELLMIWGRHDGGIGGTASAAYLGSHTLLSCAGARAAYDSLRAEPSMAWRHNWIPLLRDEDDWIAVDASRSGSPAGPLVRWAAGHDPYVASTNFTWLLRTWRVARERGIAPHDTTALAALHRELNDDLPGPWPTPEANSANGAPH